MHPREEITGVECEAELIQAESEFPGVRLIPTGTTKVDLHTVVTTPQETHALMQLGREYGFVVLEDATPLNSSCGLNFVGSPWQKVASEWHADFYSSGGLAGIFLSKADDGLVRDDTGVTQHVDFIRVMRERRELIDSTRSTFTELDLPQGLVGILQDLHARLGIDDKNDDVFALFDKFYVRLFRHNQNILQCVKNIHREITAILLERNQVYSHQHHHTNGLLVDNIEKGVHMNGPNVLHAQLLGTRRTPEKTAERSGDLWKGYVVKAGQGYTMQPSFSGRATQRVP